MRGVVALGVREGGMKLVSFTGDIALYRLLMPADFGVVVPIAFLAGIIKQFTDVGLHPSLIQRKDDPGRSDLRAVFTVHLALVTVATAIVVFAGPPILTEWIGVDADPWMIRVFGISIWLSAFRLVPAALLERHLRFGRLAAADIAGTVWYFSAGIGFAIGAIRGLEPDHRPCRGEHRLDPGRARRAPVGADSNLAARTAAAIPPVRRTVSGGAFGIDGQGLADSAPRAQINRP